ncbi:hypothetical protein FHS67_006272 [Aminobacter aminovorans]|uniref:Uncharacterized protein n=1 Tax=Aminobacter aminovorans TaxID=83263 RepID=A0AAC8YJF7_AMIAI|nr:hypothetical protein AA2016_0363 [Aminobacter aminovorans]MBB3709912.1 hypothetical protein [Aminobacter aminovorans]
MTAAAGIAEAAHKVLAKSMASTDAPSRTPGSRHCARTTPGIRRSRRLAGFRRSPEGAAVAVRPCGRAHRDRRRQVQRSRPRGGRRGRKRTAGPSWCGRDRAPALWSRRRRACRTPSAARTAARGSAGAGRLPCRPSQRASIDPGSRLGGRRSAPGDTAEGGRRTCRPNMGDGRLGRDAAFDEPRWSRRLHNDQAPAVSISCASPPVRAPVPRPLLEQTMAPVPAHSPTAPARNQANSCCGDNAYRRATALTVSPAS